MISNFVKYIFISFLSIVRGQGIINIYAELNTDAVLKCPLRDSPSDNFDLIWIGPPYISKRLGTTYFSSSADGLNPNTPVGIRLSVVGDQSAGEYNMKISNLQQSDTGRYSCVYGNNKTTYSLQLIVPVETVTVNPQTVQVIEGNLTEVNCTTSDSVPPANVTWYILRPGISAPIELTSEITKIYDNKKAISTLTYTGQKQDNSGYLYCNASNTRNGEIKSQNIPVSVLYKPSTIRILPVYDTYIVYVNQSGVELNCLAGDANPPSITYIWSHNGVTTSNNPYVIRVGKNSGGTYTCVANNTAGTISTSRIVTVQYDSEVQPFIKQQAVEGSKFVLSCNVSGNPAPTSQQIWWTRRHDNTFRQEGNQLVIDYIQKGYSDTYTCHAQNTLTPSGQSSIVKTSSQDVEVDVLYKPVLTTSPNFDTLILYVGQQNVQLTCSSTQANPLNVTYWWTYNSQNFNNPKYTFPKVTKTSGGSYICNGRNAAGNSSSTVSVVIQYGPSINPISSQKFIAGRFASVNCNVTSNPVADITWTGPNNLQQTGRTLVFNTVSKSQKGIYNCTATNTLTPSGLGKIHKQQYINVNVDILYKPEVNDIPSPSIVEGGILNITCSAVANPPVHIYKWTKMGDNTFQQLSETLVITNIRRTHSGKYRCTAINTMSPTNGQQEIGEGQREVTINVKYSPAITKLGLVGSGTTRNEGETTSLNCGIDSYPTSNVTWTTSTGNSRTEYFYNEKNISYYNITATCLDTGKYKCTASNGIGEKVTNETNLFVRCSPRIDSRYQHKENIGIKNEQGLNISARYLAYPIANVTWFFSHQNSTDKTNKTLHDSEDGINITNVNYTYWQTSELTKSSMTKDDFGVYTVIFQNDISLASSVFYVDAERAPDPPTSVRSECLEDLTVNITWQPEFDGGSEQMFIIQYRKSEDKVFMNWTRKLLDANTNMTETIKGLKHGVKYYFRVIAVNSNGETPSYEDPCKTKVPPTITSPVLQIVGGTLGTLAGVTAIVIIIIVLLVLRRRKYTKGKERDDEFSMNGKSRLTQGNSNEDEDGMRDNELYVSAGPNYKPKGATGGKRDIYSEVQKPKKSGHTSGDVYAEVKKPKAKKSKNDSNGPSDLYAVVQKPKSKDAKKGSGPVGTEGTIYENVEDLDKENGACGISGTVKSRPGPQKPQKPQKPPKKNKDGLIYLDLDLDEGTKDGKRFVIRGIEDRTQYVEVDFSKRADPLPPDDKESEAGKKPKDGLPEQEHPQT